MRINIYLYNGSEEQQLGVISSIFGTLIPLFTIEIYEFPFTTYYLKMSANTERYALISSYSHLKGQKREAEALHSLKKIASLVKPIMRARNWRVGTLTEFYPDQQNLLGIPSCSQDR